MGLAAVGNDAPPLKINRRAAPGKSTPHGFFASLSPKLPERGWRRVSGMWKPSRAAFLAEGGDSI